jgi:hypothetical protein
MSGVGGHAVENRSLPSTSTAARPIAACTARSVRASPSVRIKVSVACSKVRRGLPQRREASSRRLSRRCASGSQRARGLTVSAPGSPGEVKRRADRLGQVRSALSTRGSHVPRAPAPKAHPDLERVKSPPAILRQTVQALGQRKMAWRPEKAASAPSYEGRVVNGSMMYRSTVTASQAAQVTPTAAIAALSATQSSRTPGVPQRAQAAWSMEMCSPSRIRVMVLPAGWAVGVAVSLLLRHRGGS